MPQKKDFFAEIDSGKSLEERIKGTGSISFVNERVATDNFICVDTANAHIDCYKFNAPMSHDMVCKWLKDNEPNMGLGTIFHLLAWHDKFPSDVIIKKTILAPGTLWYKDPTWYLKKTIEYMPAMVYVGGRIGLDTRPILDIYRDIEKQKLYPAGTGWIVYKRKKMEDGRNGQRG